MLSNFTQNGMMIVLEIFALLPNLIITHIFFPMILKFDFRGVIFRIVTTGKLTLKEQVWEISEENLEKILNVNY
jgi:hypothetical protein